MILSLFRQFPNSVSIFNCVILVGSLYLCTPCSVPLEKIGRPTHRYLNPHNLDDYTRAEHRFPRRYSMLGDSQCVFEGEIPENIEDPCTFCGGHLNSETCTDFKSPSSRLSRFRSINYTLMRLNVMQICPACTTRYVKLLCY